MSDEKKVVDKKNIDDILDALTEQEKAEVLAILNEIKDTGTSDKFQTLVNRDFEEIPVDIDTFITDPQYLGTSYADPDKPEGSIVYPFWREKLRELFRNGKTNFSEAIFSGAIGIGKTTIAVIGTAYILYKLMCLKNPQQYYEQKANSKIYIAFFNITLELSFGVAYKDLQEALQKSPWFASRGTISGRKNLIYTPPKGIEFMVGSKPEHALGKNVFCLSGDTEIKLNEDGYAKLAELDNKLAIYNHACRLVEATTRKYTPVKTKKSKVVYRVTLADGTTIMCSGNHRFLLADGSYKQASKLKAGDDFKEVKKSWYNK